MKLPLFMLLAMTISTAHAENPDATSSQDVFENWVLQCLQQGEVKQCTVSQTLRTKEGQTAAVVNVNKVEEGLNIEFALPLMTALDKPVSLSIDGSDFADYPYTACNQRACFIIRKEDTKLIKAFKAGSEVAMKFSLYNGQSVDMRVSLKGFSRAVTALQERI